MVTDPPAISKTIQIIKTRYAELCRESKDKFKSDVLLWTPTHGCVDTGYSLEDLLGVMDDRDGERVREIHVVSVT